MSRLPQRLVLSGVACALLVAVGLVAWPLATDSSQAQAGSMHNCPPAGKWSIAVWDGASGTAAGDALATCGAAAVDAAYSLDSQTGAWSRWFAGKPEASNMPPFTDVQGVLALGAATGPAATPTVTPTPTPTEEAGYLPPPQEVGHISAGGSAVVTIQNGTPYGLTVEYEGPASGAVSLPACADCIEWFIGPFSFSDPCSGVPEQTVSILAGTYSVTARVDKPSISPFVGNWSLDGDREYSSCLYIKTSSG